MVLHTLRPLLAAAMALQPPLCIPSAARAATTSSAEAPASTSWPVATSLKATVQDWARRAGWPAPQFLTDADWPVDVPGLVPGSIEDALRVLVSGFGHAPSRPRIDLSINHVIVVTEMEAE